MDLAISRIGVRNLVTYTLLIVVLGFFGFIFLRSAGILRKTEALQTEFQTTDLDRVKLVTILSKDGIRAIKKPEFTTALESLDEMRADEQVIGVSINGDHRAYPLNVLAVHEIVDDVVGGVPIAVTY